jgi:hypothetical protein
MTTATHVTAESLQPLIRARDEAGILAACEPLIRHAARKWSRTAARAGLEFNDLLQTGRLALIKREEGKHSLIGNWIAAGRVTQDASVARIVSVAVMRDCQRAVAKANGLACNTAQCLGWLQRNGHTTAAAALADPSRPAAYTPVLIADALAWMPVGELPEEHEIPAPPANEDAAAWTFIDRILAASGMTRLEARPLLVAADLVPGMADATALRRTIARMLAPWSGGKTDQHSLALARQAAYRDLVLGQGEPVPVQIALALGA